MRKYGKWVLTLGLLSAAPGLTLVAGSTSIADDKPAADGKKEPKTANQRVAEEIVGAMRSKRIQGNNINIEFKGGVAILSGSVADAKMKDRATEAAKKVHGVSQVDNRMTVADKARPSLARTPAGPTGGVVSANHTTTTANPNRVQQVNGEYASGGGNQEVAEQIGAALTAAHLDGYDIEIRYQNGVALLSGSVGTQAEKATASRVVQQIPGVRSVANRLACAQEPAMPPQAAQRFAPGQMPPGYGGAMPGQMPPGYGGPMPGQPAMYPVGYRQDAQAPAGAPQPGMPMSPGVPMPPTYGQPGMGASQAVYNNPSLPDYAWPTYAQYPNSAAVSYPQQYSASAWPYIGPFYPYPQVPLGWRDATLRWDDGQWNLMFRTRTDKWWWYFNPNNW